MDVTVMIRGEQYELTGRAGAIVALVARHWLAINTLNVGCVRFDVAHRRLVPKIEETFAPILLDGGAMNIA